MKNEKYFNLEKHVKMFYIKHNWIMWYYIEQKYTIVNVIIVQNLYGRFIG